MTTKTFTRTAMAAALIACAGSGAAMAATPVTLATGTFNSKPNELASLHTYNIAGNASGEFAVTLQAGAQNELLIFSRSGTSIGQPATVQLTNTTNAPSGLAIDADGDVVVAWSQISGSNYYPFFGNATITDTIYIQRFSSNGTSKGAPITVSQTIASDSISSTNGGPETIYASSFSPPQIAMDDDGDVAIGWTQITTKCAVLNFNANGYCYGTTGMESSKTYAALYNASGAVLVAPKVVDSAGYGVASQTGYGSANLLTGMSMSGTGSLLMLFNVARDTSASLWAQLFSPGLVSKGKTFKLANVNQTYPQFLSKAVGGQINLEHASGAYYPPAAVFGGSNAPSYLSAAGMDASGNFDIAWVNASNYGVYVTRFDASGSVIGTNIGPVATLKTTTNGSCGTTVPAAGGDFQLAVSPNGSFAVTWGQAMPYTGTSKAYSTCSMEKHAQFYNADGSTNGTSILLSQGASATFNPDASLSAMDGAGNLVTVWNSISAKLTSTDTLNGLLIPAP